MLRTLVVVLEYSEAGQPRSNCGAAEPMEAGLAASRVAAEQRPESGAV